ncbi:hypothetical protein CkaCkLH20_04978 [Colletotrichum karsti]|uniref:C2H2-type domain-containing protein n=1 Tax=Colletotrichum karsti TaxID=1095194 RepID=A0A9P6I6I3_9PEZI|nr:uncharacterized protein CkaCkLH20_04978 [Colletotrichum karsti]KAF9877278.1 hypothetical protein CkaCkLH20_04978 [Colletotrichum karsti]
MANKTSQAKLNCTEPNCSATFTTKSNLTRHIKAVHGQKSRMACQKRLSNQPWNIKRHVESCDECKRHTHRAASDDGLNGEDNKNNTNGNTNDKMNDTIDDNTNGSIVADIDMVWFEESLPGSYMDLSDSFPADFDFSACACISMPTPGNSQVGEVELLAGCDQMLAEIF